MIRVLTRIILSLAALLTVVACHKQRQLTDEQLAQIFHDAFLANAYTNEKGISLDSLRLYEPIFQSYGFTTEDVQYTIGSFSTRKSAKLSDVVERAIALLEERGMQLDREVDILNSIDDIVKSRATEVVYSDSLVKYRSKRDSSKMKITIDNLRPGTYKLEFDYLIDSLDKTKKPYASHNWLEEDRKDKESEEVTTIKFNDNTTSLSRYDVNHLTRTINIDKRANRIMIELLTNPDKKETRRSVTIKRLRITRTPDIDEAREEVFNELVGVKIFDDELLFN